MLPTSAARPRNVARLSEVEYILGDSPIGEAGQVPGSATEHSGCVGPVVVPIAYDRNVVGVTELNDILRTSAIVEVAQIPGSAAEHSRRLRPVAIPVASEWDIPCISEAEAQVTRGRVAAPQLPGPASHNGGHVRLAKGRRN